MAIASIKSRCSYGVFAPEITVEVHISNGLPAFLIVGLPETAVKESKDRVRSAIINSGLEFPVKRITVNLAPADLPKEGSRFDLAIAIGILEASGQFKNIEENYEFIGELGLSGELRKVSGILPCVVAAKNKNKAVFIPMHNIDEACLLSDSTIFTANNLRDVYAHLTNQIKMQRVCDIDYFTNFNKKINHIHCNLLNFDQIYGQNAAKRAVTIAAAGFHNLLMVGPPGTGKTSIAFRLPSIIPALNEDEALEVASINSIFYNNSELATEVTNWKKIPFRHPHHTSSEIALVGGSARVMPGEISLAHNGILFLDELTEFNRKAIEVMREPMESGIINISRAAKHAVFPAKFQLIGAMNPCACGNLNHPNKICTCSQTQLKKYYSKLSEPFLDRIEMHIFLEKNTLSDNTTNSKNHITHSKMLETVEIARNFQLKRNKKLNRFLNLDEMNEYCALNKKVINYLNKFCNKNGLSMRKYHNIVKLSRTIADAEESKSIELQHLLEALCYSKFFKQFNTS